MLTFCFSLLTLCLLGISCHPRYTSEQRTSKRQPKGVSITHLAAKDEGVAFVQGNNAYSVWFELWPDIPKYRESSSILGMKNPEYELWVRNHTIEYLNLQVHRVGEMIWYSADSVDVDFASGGDTAVYSDGDMRNRRRAQSFDELPLNVRLTNRQYIFHFIDTFAQGGTAIRLNYSLRRPNGSRAVVDTTIKYRWDEYHFVPY